MSVAGYLLIAMSTSTALRFVALDDDTFKTSLLKCLR